MSLDMPVVEDHPNRIPFHGVLTYANTKSDKAPSGARGHRIVLTRAAVLQALPSLLGMSVNFKAGWDGHDYRQKCGVITAAELVDSELRVAGYIFKRDFPEVETKSKSNELGMSYELENAYVEDMRQMVWTITKFTFNGASILLKEKAAYKATSFTIGESWQKDSTKSSFSVRLEKTPRLEQPNQAVWLRAFHWLHQIGKKVKMANGQTKQSGTT